MGDRIAVMSDGVLQQIGHAAGAVRPARSNMFVAGFIGSPAMNFVDVEVQDGRLVGPGDWAIPVPPRARDAMALGGRKIVAGFRPEHLEIGETGPEFGSFRARADVVEYLGNEELLHINAADQDIVAIVDSDHRVRPGDIVDLVIPLEKVQVFDGETGETILQTPSATAAA